MEKNEITYQMYEGISFMSNNFLINKLLPWWSKKTIEEPFLLNKTPEQLQENCLCGIFSFHNDIPIGAAGVFMFNKLNPERQRLVELGSSFVDSKFRTMNIATNFIEFRLQYVKKNNFFPFSVTSNIVMDKVNIGIATPVEELNGKYEALRRLIKRDCHCTILEKETCKVCPGKHKVIWVYNDFISI